MLRTTDAAQQRPQSGQGPSPAPDQEPHMSIADANKTIVIGENPFIRLSAKDGDPNSTEASFWRVFWSPAGPGHVLYMKSELTGGAWRIWADNIAMARWLRYVAERDRGQLPPARGRSAHQLDRGAFGLWRGDFADLVRHRRPAAAALAAA
jgi:hypothetical protein